MKRSSLLLIAIGGLGALTSCGCASGPSAPPVVPATHFSVTPATATPISGTAFMLTVTALGASEQTATSYSGTLHFTSSDGKAVLPTDTAMTNVTGKFSVTLNTLGGQTITVTDTGSLKGTSNTITVSVPPPHFAVVAATYVVSAGTPDNFTVTAEDSTGATLPSYAGTVHFTSNDSNAALPADSALVNGVGSFSATLNTSGSDSITATDTTNASINGNSGAITVTGASIINQWTWEGGYKGAYNYGIFGTLGTPAPTNIPGTRYGAVTWTDKAGDFWLFGGYGYASNGGGLLGELNDFWKYSAGEWTWIGGSNAIQQQGTYGILGTPAPTNIPGAREGAVSWTDSAGNFWLFGGYAFDSGIFNGPLNDLWKYSAGQWTWISGSNVIKNPGPGTYGTKGTPAANNFPGMRQYATGWIDKSGNLWLFGGYGFDSAGTLGYLNDLWEYSAGEWTWVGGSNVVNQAGIYGTKGTAGSGNIPGSRYYAASWTDGNGDFWLFGGVGSDSTGTFAGFLNDLWKYNVGEWTWMGGANMANVAGIYGTQGMPAPTNGPGARGHATGWSDKAGNSWLFGGFGPPGFFNDMWKYSAGEWTWVGGSNVNNQPGLYGTEGTPSLSNIPGARGDTARWKDSAGNIWIFGGFGIDYLGGGGPLDDLWKYEP